MCRSTTSNSASAAERILTLAHTSSLPHRCARLRRGPLRSEATSVAVEPELCGRKDALSPIIAVARPGWDSRRSDQALSASGLERSGRSPDRASSATSCSTSPCRVRSVPLRGPHGDTARGPSVRRQGLTDEKREAPRSCARDQRPGGPCPLQLTRSPGDATYGPGAGSSLVVLFDRLRRPTFSRATSAGFAGRVRHDLSGIAPKPNGSRRRRRNDPCAREWGRWRVRP